MNMRSSTGYTRYQIILHWIIATLVLFQLIFGESMTASVDAAEEGTLVSSSDQILSVAHYWVGIAILCLVFARVVVRLIQGAPTPGGANGILTYLAKTTHFLFYLLLVGVPATGLLTIYVSDSFGDIHGFGKPAFIVLIVLHACGALFHQFFLKDGTLRRMLIPAR